MTEFFRRVAVYRRELAKIIQSAVYKARDKWSLEKYVAEENDKQQYDMAIVRHHQRILDWTKLRIDNKISEEEWLKMITNELEGMGETAFYTILKMNPRRRNSYSLSNSRHPIYKENGAPCPSN